MELASEVTGPCPEIEVEIVLQVEGGHGECKALNLNTGRPCREMASIKTV